MKLKMKLSFGLGFLFLLIITIVFFCVHYIGKMSIDSENILKDNYNSLMYTEKMHSALDDMYVNVIKQISIQKGISKPNAVNSANFDSTKSTFEKYLLLEKNNITENNEKFYVDELYKNYGEFFRIIGLIATVNSNKESDFSELGNLYQAVRRNIESITDVNMQAIMLKNQIAQKDTDSIKIIFSVVGCMCILLGFVYFWYFPFYVSNSIAYLSTKMIELLKKNNINYDFKSNDETIIILKSIDLIDNNMKITQ